MVFWYFFQAPKKYKDNKTVGPVETYVSPSVSGKDYVVTDATEEVYVNTDPLYYSYTRNDEST